VLDSGHLRKYASQHDAMSGNLCLDDINLAPCQFEEIPNEPNSFEISSPGETIHLQANTLEEKCKWIMLLVQHKFSAEAAINDTQIIEKKEEEKQPQLIYTEEIKRRRDKMKEEEKAREEKEKNIKEHKEKLEQEQTANQILEEESKLLQESKSIDHPIRKSWRMSFRTPNTTDTITKIEATSKRKSSKTLVTQKVKYEEKNTITTVSSKRKTIEEKKHGCIIS